MSPSWSEWLRRVRHDLVKRLLWPARDRRDLGGPVRPGELVASLIDEEGKPASAETVWARLLAAAPVPQHPALASFAAALPGALGAARRDDLAGVLALEAAFDRLAADLAGEKA
jgi:hypothetical protein